MLRQLFIKNIALIDKIEIEFCEGLNIVTGETGAGKSIVIDSINAVLGSRLSKDLIRTGESSALVEAFFEIENDQVQNFIKNNELDDETSQLILSREFNTQGKNVCRINGRVVTTVMLKELGQLLVDIHGQHDNQSLLNSSTHIDLLDSFGGEKILAVKNQYFQIYQKVKTVKRKMEQLGGDSRERERKLDLLKFQLDEIEAAKLRDGEDQELEAQRDKMLNSGKIASSIEGVYDILYAGNKTHSITDYLNLVIKELGNIQKFDESIEKSIGKVENAYYLIEDVVSEIREYKETLEYDPKMLDIIEERLDHIYKLKRKYGQSISDILAYKGSLEEELKELEQSQEHLEGLTHELDILNGQLSKLSIELSTIRREIAKVLEERIVKELEDLEMKRTQFKVDFEEIGNQYTAKGIDKVEFLISPNAGESLKPLSKIASGGEMSRIMLAIKTILAGVDEIPTLIFDEIDTGISGKVAQKVGQKLSYIARNHQVFCVTHLPQIAAISDNHYLIEKHIEDSITKTSIRKLSLDEKRHELARILGGVRITETTLKHAEEMIELAQQRKNA